MHGRAAYSTLVLMLAAGSAIAQTAQTSPDLLEQIAAIVDRGKLHVEVDLQHGRAAIVPQWTVEVIGTPKATLVAEANNGHVRSVDIDVSGGELIVDGKWLRPDVSIEGLRFEEGKGIVETRFRGRRAWRPIVAMFRGLARPALRKLEIPTDIPSLLRGEFMSSKKSTPTSTGGAFLDLVREVHIDNSEFIAFSGRPLVFGTMVELQTAAREAPLRAAIDKATFRPPRNGKPAEYRLEGRLDGEVENGAVSFVGSRCTFSRGRLTKGSFRAFSSKKGELETSFSAGAFELDLNSGRFTWPGGPKIGVDAPSRFTVRDLRVRADGSYSGIVDATLFGKVGTIDRGGTTLAASDVELRTQGAKVVDGKATGDVNLNFQYSLNHTLTIHYPVEELRDRRVPLLFQGSFAADLHFQDAGSGDEGVVTGTYRFNVPWPPIEQAAFEVLRARWSQDVAPAIHKVNFAIEPRRFGPCGEKCFLLDLTVTAEKAKKEKGYFFQQICDSQGRADLVVDPPTRSLILRNLHVEPRCRGIIGSIVNFVAPFLTKSYSDVTVLQMPADLPFTIESVGSDSNTLIIAGKMVWAMKNGVSGE